MITTLTTTGKWAAGGSMLLASATLLGTTAGANPTGGEGATLGQPVLTAAEMATPSSSFDDLKDALKGGKLWANFRYRYENVDDDGPKKQARASTLRTRLGYESAEWNNMTGLLEFSDVARIGPGATDYNDGLNGKTNYSVVKDPKNTQVNQVYLKYDALWDGDLKLGRQRIKLDNDRFIGNVGWRQTEQVYDAITYFKPDIAGIAGYYGFIRNVNSIVGSNQKSEHHLLNVSKSWENLGKLTAYGYYLDFDAAKTDNTFSYGLRFTGEREFTENDWALLYTAEMANQNDVADNPQKKTDVSYFHGNIGGRVQGFTGAVGWELLGGDTNSGGASFQTPLATLHAHNGWADMFLTTPAHGLQDTYLKVGYKWDKLGVTAFYHNFDRHKTNNPDYGSEIDIKGTYKTPWGVDVGLGFADFQGKTGSGYGDTQKLWMWLYYSF